MVWRKSHCPRMKILADDYGEVDFPDMEASSTAEVYAGGTEGGGILVRSYHVGEIPGPEVSLAELHSPFTDGLGGLADPENHRYPDNNR